MMNENLPSSFPFSKIFPKSFLVSGASLAWNLSIPAITIIVCCTSLIAVLSKFAALYFSLAALISSNNFVNIGFTSVTYSPFVTFFSSIISSESTAIILSPLIIHNSLITSLSIGLINVTSSEVKIVVKFLKKLNLAISRVPFSTPTGTLSRPVNSPLTNPNVTLAGKIGTALALNVVALESSSHLALITSFTLSGVIDAVWNS